MPRIPFDQLPSDARLWIFAAERPMSGAESARVLEETDSFIDRWMAREAPDRRPRPAPRPVRPGRRRRAGGGRVGLFNRRAGPAHAAARGRARARARQQRAVLYREGEAIERVSRDRFAELAASGTVGPNTRVFDNTLTRVGNLLAGKWEVKAADAWHAARFSDAPLVDWKIGRLTEC